MHKRTSTAWILITLVFSVAAANAPTVVESWLVPAGGSEYRNLMVIGITDDQEARHHFEDKFVSHLRGRGVDAVTSHSLVPDLQSIEDRDAILNKIMEQRIDAAISVRLVPLEESDEGSWAAGWAASIDEEANLRRLIDETLPVKPTKASRFGLEIAVWETEQQHRVWAGRTGVLTKKQLHESAGDFVKFTIRALREAHLLP